MKGLKNFDFFQKISVDNVTQPTIVGSLLSLSAISLILFLLVREVMDFFTPCIKRESIVYQDPDQKSKINVNINIKFVNMPCAMISVDQEDSVGNHRLDIGDTLTKYILHKGGLPKQEYIKQGFVEVDQVVKSIEDEEGCFISGHVPVSKVPGDIHVSHHNYADIFYYLKSSKPDSFSKISLNHKVEYIYFGDQKLNEKILNRFGLNDMQSGFNRLSQLPSYEHEPAKKNFDYFVKMIPHLFVEESTGESFTGYQYSMTTRSKAYNTDSQEMAKVVFFYDLSPITMKITLVGKSFAHSLTHVCAIVGGIYVIFSILNRLLLAFCDFSVTDKKGVAAIS